MPEFKWVSLQLIAVITIIFIIQTINPAITDEFALISSDAFDRPWILLTSVMLHGSFEHLIYNMFALGLFGSILEKIIGWKKFLIVFIASGIVASTGSIPYYQAALGASGAIFGILGALTALRPKLTVFVGYVPMPMIVAAAVWVVGDLVGIFIPSNVANIAHIVGLGFGVLAGLYLRKEFGEKQVRKRKDYTVSEEDFQAWERNYF